MVDAQHAAGEVDVEHALPLGQHGLGDGVARAGDARVVDQTPQGLSAGLHLGDHGLPIAVAGHIGHMAVQVSGAGTGHAGQGVPGWVAGGQGIHHMHIGPGLQQQRSQCRTLAAHAPGDHHGTAVPVEGNAGWGGQRSGRAHDRLIGGGCPHHRRCV